MAQTPSDKLENTGIVYGEDHAFILKAPAGWGLDNKSGASEGIHAVFYPAGGSWENSNTVMYANTANKRIEGNETIEKLIEVDLANFLQRGTEVFKDTVIIINDSSKKAILKYFKAKSNGNFEIAAYIDEEMIVSLLVLSSRDEKEFVSSVPKFIELLNSYIFVTKNVQLKE